MHFLILLSDKGWALPQGPRVAFETTPWSPWQVTLQTFFLVLQGLS